MSMSAYCVLNISSAATTTTVTSGAEGRRVRGCRGVTAMARCAIHDAVDIRSMMCVSILCTAVYAALAQATGPARLGFLKSAASLIISSGAGEWLPYNA